MSEIKYSVADGHDDATHLHVTDDVGMKEMGREVVEFVTRRIREMNGVDESDHRPACAGCISGSIANGLMIMAMDALEGADAELCAYLAADFDDSISRIGEAATLLGLRGLIGEVMAKRKA